MNAFEHLEHWTLQGCTWLWCSTIFSFVFNSIPQSEQEVLPVYIFTLHSGMLSQGFVSLLKHRPTTWFWEFLTFSHMNSVFFQANAAWKLNWIEKRLNSCEKMSKICKIMLSADVFTTKQNVVRHCDFINFLHFHQWIESFFNPINFTKAWKLNWVEKRLNSLVKMSKICEITLSADVLTTKQNLEKHSTVLLF